MWTARRSIRCSRSRSPASWPTSCGTTPEHIQLLVERLAGRRQTARPARPLPMVSSAIRATSLLQAPPPMLIGERLNSQGSRRMKELLLADDYDRMLELAHEQVNGG